MNWELYRNEYGELDLLKLFADQSQDTQGNSNYSKGWMFINDIITIQPIKSRQLAAAILVTALHISK